MTRYLSAPDQLVSGTLYLDLDDRTQFDEIHNVSSDGPFEYAELCFMRGEKHLSTILVDATTGRIVRSWDYSEEGTVARDLTALAGR